MNKKCVLTFVAGCAVATLVMSIPSIRYQQSDTRSGDTVVFVKRDRLTGRTWVSRGQENTWRRIISEAEANDPEFLGLIEFTNHSEAIESASPGSQSR